MNGVLFDLDGTLADTAQDLAYALNQVLLENNYPELAFEKIRPVVSHGGIALIRLGFNLEPTNSHFETLRLRLLDIYQQNICRSTCLFPSIDTLLKQLESSNISWGIVTNKPDWLTHPLLKELKLNHRSKSIVCGNTLKVNKPNPEPIFHACTEMNIAPENCIYIGDARRDIEAGKNANMPTIAAAYGYVEADDPAENWQADYLIYKPEDLWTLIKNHFNIASN